LKIIIKKIVLTHINKIPKVITDGTINSCHWIDCVNIATLGRFSSNQVNWKEIHIFRVIETVIIYQKVFKWFNKLKKKIILLAYDRQKKTGSLI
jgi:hypothetical protein